MKQWRPKDWDSNEMHLDMLRANIDDMDGEAFIEAGADAMHKADIEWILKHLLITEGVFTKEDWEAFIDKEGK